MFNSPCLILRVKLNYLNARRSNSLQVVSSDAEMNALPSGKNSTEFTSSVCPGNTWYVSRRAIKSNKEERRETKSNEDEKRTTKSSKEEIFAIFCFTITRRFVR